MLSRKTLKKKLKLQDEIDRARFNKKPLPFEAVSIPRQRVRIIKDAIAQIKIGTFAVETGNYMSLTEDFNLKDLKKIIIKGANEKQEVCQVCAKGAIFAACVLNDNKVKTGDDIDDEPFQRKKLSKWFTELELDMMETAFETEVICDNSGQLYSGENGIADKCRNFGQKYEDEKERLLAILENTLQNGTFTP